MIPREPSTRDESVAVQEHEGDVVAILRELLETLEEAPMPADAGDGTLASLP